MSLIASRPIFPVWRVTSVGQMVSYHCGPGLPCPHQPFAGLVFHGWGWEQMEVQCLTATTTYTPVSRKSNGKMNAALLCRLSATLEHLLKAEVEALPAYAMKQQCEEVFTQCLRLI